jgi:hypothetical protein
MDFSVVSVTFVSVPAPPSKESLPLTLSLELTASSPSSPFRVSAPSAAYHLVIARPTLLGIGSASAGEFIVRTRSSEGVSFGRAEQVLNS